MIAIHRVIMPFVNRRSRLRAATQPSWLSVVRVSLPRQGARWKAFSTNRQDVWIKASNTPSGRCRIAGSIHN